MNTELDTMGNMDDMKFQATKRMQDMDKNELFDNLIDDVNGWGAFQIRIGLLSLIVTLLTACNHHSPLYTVYKPKHMCISSNYSGVYPRTEHDGTSYIHNLEHNFNAIYQEKFSCTPRGYENDSQKCREWIYDRSVFTDTIVTEWDLVCDRLVLLPTVASSYMAGVVIINTLGGVLSDSIGRRKTVLIFAALHLVFSILTSASQTYLMFVAVRFFVGGCIHTVWSAMFVIAVEIVSEPMRNITGAIFNLGWNTGSMVMTLLSFGLRSWWKLQIAFAILSLPLATFYFIIPESPRWLLEKGKTNEAREVLLKIAKVNKTDIEKTKFYQHFEELESRILQEHGNLNEERIKRSLMKEFTNTFAGVFTCKEYLLRLFLMIPPWVAVGCSAYGLHFSSKLVNFDIFSLAAIKEAVAFAIILLIVPFFKRGKRIPSVLTVYLIGGTLAIIFYFIPANQTTLEVTIFVLCQGFILGLFYVIGTYTQDVFSTDIRGTTFNFLDCISKIGTMFAPFIVDLIGEQDGKLPVAIFGIIVLIASSTLLFLPETKGLPLVQSYKDLNHHSCGKTSVLGKLWSKVSNTD